MTAEELELALEALKLFLSEDFVFQLRDILSFFIGTISGISFVIAASYRW